MAQNSRPAGTPPAGILCSYLASRSPHEAALPPATPIRSVLPISGIYDLRPITTSYLQPELHLTPEEVAHWSPIEAVPSPDTHFEIAVGHARDRAAPSAGAGLRLRASRRAGADAERITIAGHEHMSIVRALGRPGNADGLSLSPKPSPAPPASAGKEWAPVRAPIRSRGRNFTSSVPDNPGSLRNRTLRSAAAACRY